jgi:hypothetical protein
VTGTHTRRWCYMRNSNSAVTLSAILGVIGCNGLTGAEAGDTEKPTSAEIRSLERRVRLPDKAPALRTYVRYYYALGDSGSGGRSIEGIYIAKSYFRPADIPPGDIVVVGAETDVSVPADAKCTVLFVTYNPDSKTAVASCSASLVLKVRPASTDLE